MKMRKKRRKDKETMITTLLMISLNKYPKHLRKKFIALNAMFVKKLVKCCIASIVQNHIT